MYVTSLNIPKLIGVQNGLQDSRAVCLLVEISDDLVGLPSSGICNVLNRQSLSGCGPASPIGMPEMPLLACFEEVEPSALAQVKPDRRRHRAPRNLFEIHGTTHMRDLPPDHHAHEQPETQAQSHLRTMGVAVS